MKAVILALALLSVASAEYVTAKYDDEAFFDRGHDQVSMIQTETYVRTGLHNTLLSSEVPSWWVEAGYDQEPQRDHTGEKSQLFNPLQLEDLPEDFVHAGYSGDDFFHTRPDPVLLSLDEEDHYEAPLSGLTAYFRYDFPQPPSSYVEAAYEDESRYEHPRVRFARARFAQSQMRAAQEPEGEPEGDFEEGAPENAGEEQPGEQPEEAGAQGEQSGGQDFGGTDPAVLGQPPYTGRYGYPLPVGNSISKGLNHPYYGVPVQPMIPQYQIPKLLSPPLNMYSDGTRYPLNMNHYTHYAPAAAA